MASFSCFHLFENEVLFKITIKLSSKTFEKSCKTRSIGMKNRALREACKIGIRKQYQNKQLINIALASLSRIDTKY